MTFKSIKTLWVIFVILLISITILGMFSEGLEVFKDKGDVSDIITIGLFGSLFSFFTYGIVFWPLVLLFMFLFELVFVNKKTETNQIKKILALEWLIISIPFVYWAITQDYPIWFYFIIVLGMGQYVRLRIIK